MTLLKTIVLLDIVEIVSSDDHRTLHLKTLDNTSEDPATNTNIPSERTFLVNVSAFGSLEKMCVCT